MGVHPEFELAQLGEPSLVPVFPFLCALFLLKHLVELDLKVGFVEHTVLVLRVWPVDVPLCAEPHFLNHRVTCRPLVDEGGLSVVARQRPTLKVILGIVLHVAQQAIPFVLGNYYFDIVQVAQGEKWLVALRTVLDGFRVRRLAAVPRTTGSQAGRHYGGHQDHNQSK